jgi:hypothetical protein
MVREIEPLQTGAPVAMRLDSFTMNGLNIQIESPIREIQGWQKG